MPTNQEYMDRWEDAAPTPVDSNPTPEEIQKMQGTRNSDKPRWENYMEEAPNPELDRQIAEYAKNVHDSTSNQNKEELHRWQEKNEPLQKEYQFVKPDEYNDVLERKGKIMHSSEFIKKLQSAGVHCWYSSHPHADKLVLRVQRLGQPPEMGCWAQNGWMPELSIMNFDEHGIPLAEKFRGWRTCLLQLILKSVIAEKKADEIFGKPKTTAAFHRYNELLFQFRRAGGSLNKEE